MLARGITGIAYYLRETRLARVQSAHLLYTRSTQNCFSSFDSLTACTTAHDNVELDSRKLVVGYS